MFFLQAIVALACLFSSGTAKQKQIVVAQDGSGQYTSIQQAINAAPANSSEPVVIFIKKGNYSTEKLIIPADKKQLKLLGESREQTIISYAIYDCNSPASQNKCPGYPVAEMERQ